VGCHPAARSCGARMGAAPGAASPAARPTPSCLAWPARAPAPVWPWEEPRSCGARTGAAPGAASSDAKGPECAIPLSTRCWPTRPRQSTCLWSEVTATAYIYHPAEVPSSPQSRIQDEGTFEVETAQGTAVTISDRHRQSCHAVSTAVPHSGHLPRQRSSRPALCGSSASLASNSMSQRSHSRAL
jgi:hypothetical protein